MSEIQEALQFITDQARRLLAEHSTPERLKELLDQPGGFDSDLWGKTNELGWCAAAIPEENGGIGLGWEALCNLSEVLGEATASLPLIQNSVTIDALLRSGVDQQSVVDALLTGEAIATLAVTDKGKSGVPLTPDASIANGKLSGDKAFTPFAAVADYALVSATDGKELAVLLVDLQQPGVTRGIESVIDNSRGVASLSFDQVDFVRLDSGNALELLLRIIGIAATVVTYEQVGGTQACLAASIEYAKERKVFGMPIGSFQAVKHNLADMYTAMEVARGCAIDALDALECENPGFIAFAAAARLGGIKCYEFASKENIQTHGGIGVTWEAQPHHHYRRSRSLSLELGSSTFWRDLLVDNIPMLAEGY